MKVILYTYNWYVDADGNHNEEQVFVSPYSDMERIAKDVNCVPLGEGVVKPQYYSKEYRTELKLNGLEKARETMREEFLRQLENIDNQIQQLKALTYENPAD